MVADSTITEAPYSEGLKRKPPAPKVLSTINGIWCFSATLAIASKSATFSVGLPMVSIYRALVFSSINASESSGLSSFAILASIPSFLKLTVN